MFPQQEDHAMTKRPSPFMHVLNRVDTGLSWIEAFIVAGSMLVIAINTIANVISRYVLSHSLYFSEELNEIFMVTVTFVGLGYVTRKGRHIRMSAIYDMVPEAARRYLMAFIALTTAAVMFLLAWEAWEYVAKVAARGRVTPAMQVPLWTTYVGVVVGLVLTGIQYLATVWVNLARRESVWISHEETDAYDDPELITLLEMQEEHDKRETTP